MGRGGLLAVMALAGLTAGCATLSEEECLNADWVGIGFTDGTNGRSPSRLDEHARACAQHQLGVNAEAWRAGYEDGLVRYCTPFNGAREGASGDTYRGVCPAVLEGDFLAGYREGRDVLRIWQVYEAELNELRRIDNAIDNRTDRIQDLRARLDNEDLTDEERQRLRGELRGLRGERRRLRQDRADTEYAADRAREAAFRAADIFDARYPGAAPSSWR